MTLLDVISMLTRDKFPSQKTVLSPKFFNIDVKSQGNGKCQDYSFFLSLFLSARQ